LRLYFKKAPALLAGKFNQIEEIYISAIVYAELSARQIQLQEFIALTTFHSWDEKAAVIYAKIRANLKAKGTTIGNMDILIAAHALSLNATLVTNNLREFEKVPELKLENWVIE
jgi:tRNA(fMet)-specific endonuclease VapC